MNSLLHEQIDELLTKSDDRIMRGCERALRVAAVTLYRARQGEITATTVVSDITDDGIDAVVSLAADIADEYGLEARIKQEHGSCSVRFSRPEPNDPNT